MGLTHPSFVALLIGWVPDGTANRDFEECGVAVYENTENVLRDLTQVVELSNRAPTSGVATLFYIGANTTVYNAQQRKRNEHDNKVRQAIKTLVNIFDTKLCEGGKPVVAILTHFHGGAQSAGG